MQNIVPHVPQRSGSLPGGQVSGVPSKMGCYEARLHSLFTPGYPSSPENPRTTALVGGRPGPRLLRGHIAVIAWLGPSPPKAHPGTGHRDLRVPSKQQLGSTVPRTVPSLRAAPFRDGWGKVTEVPFATPFRHQSGAGGRRIRRLPRAATCPTKPGEGCYDDCSHVPVRRANVDGEATQGRCRACKSTGPFCMGRQRRNNL